MTRSELAAIEARAARAFDPTYPAVLLDAEAKHDVRVLLAHIRYLEGENAALRCAVQQLRDVSVD